VPPCSTVFRRFGLAKKGVRYFLSSVSKLALQHPNLVWHQKRRVHHAKGSLVQAGEFVSATFCTIEGRCAYSLVKFWSFLGSSGFLCKASSRLDGLPGSLEGLPCMTVIWARIMFEVRHTVLHETVWYVLSNCKVRAQQYMTQTRGRIGAAQPVLTVVSWSLSGWELLLQGNQAPTNRPPTMSRQANQQDGPSPCQGCHAGYFKSYAHRMTGGRAAQSAAIAGRRSWTPPWPAP